LRRCGHFSFFKMAAVRHLEYRKVENCNCHYSSEGQICVTITNFVTIGRSVVKIWSFFDFSRWRPSSNLNYQKLKILTAVKVQRVNLRHRIKFRTDRTIHCQDTAFFDFSRWQPSAILDFQKLGILIAGYCLEGQCVPSRHHAKFCRCQDMAVFRFF